MPSKREKSTNKKFNRIRYPRITKSEEFPQLPSDVWGLIAQNLAPVELCRVRRTCSLFYKKSESLVVPAKIRFAEKKKKNLFNLALVTGDCQLLEECLKRGAKWNSSSMSALCQGGTVQIAMFLFKHAKTFYLPRNIGTYRNMLMRAGKIGVATVFDSDKLTFSEREYVEEAMEIFDTIASASFRQNHLKTEKEQIQMLEGFSRVVTPEIYKSWLVSFRDCIKNVNKIPTLSAYRFPSYYEGRSFVPSMIWKAAWHNYPEHILQFMIRDYMEATAKDYVESFLFFSTFSKWDLDSRSKFLFSDVLIRPEDRFHGNDYSLLTKIIAPHYLEAYLHPDTEISQIHLKLLEHFGCSLL